MEGEEKTIKGEWSQRECGTAVCEVGMARMALGSDIQMLIFYLGLIAL